MADVFIVCAIQHRVAVQVNTCYSCYNHHVHSPDTHYVVDVALFQRDTGDARGKAYLRTEFLKRIEHEPIVYKLQIQFKNAFTDDANDLDWNPQTVSAW